MGEGTAQGQFEGIVLIPVNRPGDVSFSGLDEVRKWVHRLDVGVMDPGSYAVHLDGRRRCQDDLVRSFPPGF